MSALERALASALLAAMSSVACAGSEGSPDSVTAGSDSALSGAASGAPESSGRVAGQESGEEDATQYAITESYDQVRGGVRLSLSFDSTAKVFVGTMENASDATIERVRVEVHLSNGVELGPTEPTTLASGSRKPVRLSAAGQDFRTWSAHAEAGSGEHGPEDGEHGKEERGEHGKGRRGDVR
jgi:hypothetical protein